VAWVQAQVETIHEPSRPGFALDFSYMMKDRHAAHRARAHLTRASRRWMKPD
jgi:hypothetical protein